MGRCLRDTSVATVAVAPIFITEAELGYIIEGQSASHAQFSRFDSEHLGKRVGVRQMEALKRA